MWSNKVVEEQLNSMNYKEDVISLGRLQLNELSKVMAAAYALTFVPFFEGFGIPALEAMQSGVPVITSNTSSLPEVVGEAAILCDPSNIEEIKGAMQIVVENELLREKMIEKGLKQSEKFSWDQSAERLWDAIEKVLKDVRKV